MAQLLEDNMFHKAMKAPSRQFLLGIAGGAFIAFGFVMYTTTLQGAPADLPLGLMKTIAGIMFSTGLTMIVLTGADLFTSTTLTVIPLISGRLSKKIFARHWLISYSSNLVGAVFVALLIFFSGTWHTNNGAWGAVILQTTLAKINHSWTETLFLGILANILVCTAIFMGTAATNVTDKFIACAIPVAIFVGGGFEHSIANMFMLPLGWILKTFGGAAFFASPGVQASGITAADLEHITLGHIVWDNLIPATLGNIIGGSICLGLTCWIAYRKQEKA